MPRYNRLTRREKGMVDGINAQRLRDSYDGDQLRSIVSAREVAFDRMEALGESYEGALRTVLGRKGIRLPGKNWSYQLVLARKILNGEYGGPREAEQEQLAEEEQLAELGQPAERGQEGEPLRGLQLALAL